MTNYLVIEIQNNVVLPVHVKESRAEAESTYHMILASACISSVETHTAVLMNNEGFVIDSKCYKHPVETKALEEETKVLEEETKAEVEAPAVEESEK